jgi:hypothetical protein
MYVCIVYCMYCFDLKWNSHVDSINDNVSLILKKSSKRLYFLRQLKRANVPAGAAEMICFLYCIASDRDSRICIARFSLRNPKFI